MGSNHGNLQNPPLLALGYRELRELPRLFQNVSVRDPRHNTDHYIILGCLPGAPLAATQRYLGGTEAMADEATGGTLADKHAICGSTESRTKTNTAGSETKRLDLGGNVATHRRESLHAPGPAVRSDGQAEVGEGDQGESRKGQAEEDGGGGGGGGGHDEGGSTPHSRGVAPP